MIWLYLSCDEITKSIYCKLMNMEMRLWQHRRVFLTCIYLVIVSRVQSSVAGVSEWETTTTDDVSFYEGDGTLRSQTTIEFPDMWTSKFKEIGFGLVSDVTHFKIDFHESHIYFWDKINLSPSEYQESYCPYRCKDGKMGVLKESHTFCADIFCFPCSCQKPECQIYGICCPDISVAHLSPPDKGLNSTNKTGQISYLSALNINGALGETSLYKLGNLADHNSSSSKAGNEHARTLEYVDSKTVIDSRVVGVKVQPRLGCHRYKPENILYIRSCRPDVHVSSEVLQKCESNIPEDEVGFNTFARVTDNQTKVVYYNHYCAECNDVKQQHNWVVDVTCKTFMRVYRARSLDEFLRQALNTPDCRIVQKAPENLPTVPCEDQWFTPPTVDTCNVTGLWREYDGDVVTGCASLTSPADVVVYMLSYWKRWYRNIFCAICNKDYPKLGLRKCGYGDIRGEAEDRFSPYSILFNMNDKPTTDGGGIEETCNATQWLSPDGSCIPVHCSPGKNLIDGNCTTAVTQISGLGYRLQLWFSSEVNNIPEKRFTIDLPPSSQFILKKFRAKLSDFLSPANDFVKLFYGALLNTSTLKAFHQPDDKTPKSTSAAYSHVKPSATTTSTSTEKIEEYHFRVPYLYWITGTIIARSGVPRDTFEQTILDELFSKEILLNYSDRISVKFRPVLMWHDFDITTYCSNIGKKHYDIACFRYILYMDKNKTAERFSGVFDLFLNFTKTLTCKYVSFKRSQYLIETTYKNLLPVVTVKLNFSTTQLTITNDSDLSKMSVDASGELNVCCDVLDQQIALLSGVGKEPGLMQTVQYVLSLVCMGVSIACLLLTVVTYARFSVLRSVAGRNTLCLCLSLLLAQASLLASFFTDVKSPLCVPLGMLTHFCWLSLFSWNFICCFYMYNVFAKIRNLQVNSRSQNLTLIKNVAFTLLTPAIIVSAVVVGAYVTSGGSSLGYGGSVCYLNDRILVGATTIGPVVLISITNIIFFLKTVYNIHGVGRLQKCETSKKDDRNNLYIYVKLSTMTGAFWLTFIVAEVSDLDGLRILAIIMNGLQGLFIFMSYICNKRVLMLYLPHVIRDTTVTTRTGTSTISVPNAHRVKEAHELQATQSVSSVCSEPADASARPTDSIPARLDSSLDQAADGIVPQK